MISSRLPRSLEPNAVARAIDAKRRRGVAIHDLTATNPTSAGFTYPAELLQESVRIAGLCHFRMGSLRYEYPSEVVPAGLKPIAHLRALTWQGAQRRWRDGIEEKNRRQIENELALIEKLEYEHFFLTVHDIVHWARAQSPPILCQGRGSAANSAVCYCLGITEIDPIRSNLLFERFISEERDEPPDIDVEAWLESIQAIDRWRPSTLFLTHFGAVTDGVSAHLQALADNLQRSAALVRESLEAEGTDEERKAQYEARMMAELRAQMPEELARAYETAAGFRMSWPGLARYWRKKDEKLLPA